MENIGMVDGHEMAEINVNNNKLLALLGKDDLGIVRHKLRRVTFRAGTYVGLEGQQIERVYFLTNGIGSVLPKTPKGARAEAGIFGADGYIPSSAVTGVDVFTYDVQIQIPAEGFELAYDDFSRFMEEIRAFNKIMIRAIEAFAVQLAFTAVSNAVHTVSERLARWILMCHDRIRSDSLPLTHDFMAMMLGVRRPSVTTSLHVLEGLGLIRSERGLVIVRNRRALEMFAADAYGKPEREYERLMTGLS